MMMALKLSKDLANVMAIMWYNKECASPTAARWRFILNSHRKESMNAKLWITSKRKRNKRWKEIIAIPKR